MANRIIGPSEYKQIAKQNKVTPKNFDQYFMRQGKNIVYRDQAVNPTTGTANAAAGVAQEAKPQYEIFGNAIMDLLKQYQGIEKYPYAKQGFNAQQEQINRIQASPDQNMVGASPEQQNAVRGASVAAVQPTVSGANEAGRTFASRLNTFGDILGQARGLQQQMEQSAQQAKADARTLINNAFATTGGSEFLNMNPKELAGLEKTAGLPKDYIHNTVQAIKAREEKLKQEELKSRAPQTMETSGGIFQWNPASGKWEATGLRGKPTGGGIIKRQTSWQEINGVKVLVDDQTGEIINAMGQQLQDKQGQSFDQYLAQEEEKAGMTFAPAKREQLKQQFQSQQPASEVDSIMAGTMNLQDISVKDNHRSDVASKLTQRFNEARKSGDIEGIMRASAAFDKEPGDTFLTSMEKTNSVLSQIGVLQESINKQNTGPIVGAFRSANPWDTKAQVIKAQLNAIIPNLARGVYGEVGVLTDNDIKQYAKTLPTLTSTEEIRNAILYITVDQIRKNVEIKIKNQAAGQRDMSMYTETYKDLKDTASNIITTIPSSSQQSTQPQAMQLPNGTVVHLQSDGQYK